MTTLYAPSSSPNLAYRSFQTAGRHLEAEQNDNKRNVASSMLAWGYGLTMAFALCVGTGGTIPSQSLGQRDIRFAKEYKESPQSHLADLSVAIAPRTAAEALTHVRDVLKPAVTELASLFHVSRQAIYNWQAGEHISEVNQTLLFELAAAADTILSHPLANRVNARRKLPGGKTLLEAVANGIPGGEAAGMLISLIEKEGVQRAAIEMKLKNRQRVTVDLAEIGSPHTYEKT
ncbi:MULTISPECIES: hypothetical protein [Pseudomonas]|uniref:hypothetical protein n=1 Tax=Pseudomonas TaxID=286 RepID=UPI0003741D5E|nr:MULTISPECIES: hypothetical protein [Pseudomonas]QEU26405.1 Cro/Cl family transcriptional regulator [Pseudomonas luteola]